MYARVKFFTISLHTFEIPDFIRFQSPGDRFSFSEPVRPLPSTYVQDIREIPAIVIEKIVIKC